MREGGRCKWEGGGEELGEVELEKTPIRIYYMRKKSNFNKRKKQKQFVFKML